MDKLIILICKDTKRWVPKWLYPQIGQETAYWSVGKKLMIAMTKIEGRTMKLSLKIIEGGSVIAVVRIRANFAVRVLFLTKSDPDLGLF